MTTDLTTKQDMAPVPDYLRTRETGLDSVRRYAAVSRVKVIQSMTDSDLKEEFGEGAIILRPDNVLVASASQPVNVVPIYAWPSWAKWRDGDDTSGEPPIIAEVYDPKHEIAVKAQNFATRAEDYPDNPKLQYRHVSNLNFAIEVVSGPAAGSLAVLTYSRGSYADGQRFIGYLRRRADAGVPIYGNVVELQTDTKTNKKKQTWYTVFFGPPANGKPYVTAEQLPHFKAKHIEIGKAQETATFGVAADDAVAASTDEDLPI